MNPKHLLITALLMAVFQFGNAQKILFLHHSVGTGVYTDGQVPSWIDNYNTEHGTHYIVTDHVYPNSPYPWDNYPYDYWNLWINNGCDNSNPDIACLDSLCAHYDVISFKHCFPAAYVLPDAAVSSVSSSEKTLGNYKLQYRALRDLMDTYPNNKFIVWTLAPLSRLGTDPATASRARSFVDWVKNDWLREEGKSHPNIFVFDFWGQVAETDSSPSNGMLNSLKYDFERDHSTSESHPNLAGNQFAGPKFAESIVRAIEYVPEIKVASLSVASENGENTITSLGGSLQLSVVIGPVDATNQEVIWSVQNGTGQASLSEDGLLTAIADGTVTVFATAKDGSGVTGSLVITISKQQIPTSLDPGNKDPLIIGMNDRELRIRMPEYSRDRKVNFYNLTGSLVLSRPAGERDCTVNISSMAAGLYILVVSDNAASTVLKFAKP